MPRLRPGATGVTPPDPDEVLRIGIIGTGGMGTGHLNSFLALNRNGREKVQVVALADVCKPRLENALRIATEGQEGVVVASYSDYHDLLAREDLHGVLIASPEHWHAQHAMDAIRAGKDVYCEKPMTLRLWQALELRKVVHDHDRVFLVGTQMIMQPKYHKAKELIASGAIGPLIWSQTSYCRNSRIGEWNYYEIDPRVVPGEMLDWDAWCGPMPKIPFDTKIYHRWRRYKDWSTGIVGDLLVHKMSPLFWALDLDYPTRVCAAGGHIVDLDMENHDQVNLLIQWANGHQMVVAGSTENEIGIEDIIRGHQATLYLGGANCRLQPERIFADEVDPVDFQGAGVQDQDECRLHWMKCMRTREEPMPNIEVATKVMVAVDLATRSMWEGHAFTFDADKMEATRA